MEVTAYNSSEEEYLSSNPRRRSLQELDSRSIFLANQKKGDQEHKANQSNRGMEVGAYRSSAKAHLSSNPRRRSQEEFNSRPAFDLLNNQRKPHDQANQSKVTDVGAYSASGREHLSSNPRRRSQQEFDSRPAPVMNQKKAQSKDASTKNSRPVWDCGSSLYDSVELDSFKRQLDSAISCRTMSMPHLSDRRAPPPQQPTVTASKKKTSSSKLSRSIQKLLRSVFKPNKAISNNNNNNSGAIFRVQGGQQSNIKDGFYVVYDKTGALKTIPEVVPHEFDFGGLSPEIGALVRRTGSERFTATTTSNIGISCA